MSLGLPMFDTKKVRQLITCCLCDRVQLQWDTGNAGSIKINSTEYFLQQCHWHSPSEHTINGRRSLFLFQITETCNHYWISMIVAIKWIWTIKINEPRIEFYANLTRFNRFKFALIHLLESLHISIKHHLYLRQVDNINSCFGHTYTYLGMHWSCTWFM